METPVKLQWKLKLKFSSCYPHESFQQYLVKQLSLPYSFIPGSHELGSV